MAYNQIRLIQLPVTHKYVVPDHDPVNQFLEFLGSSRLKQVTYLPYPRRDMIIVIIRYNSSDNYENQVDDYFNNL